MNAVKKSGPAPGQLRNRRRRQEARAMSTLGQLYQDTMAELQRRRRMLKKDRHLENVVMGHVLAASPKAGKKAKDLAVKVLAARQEVQRRRAARLAAKKAGFPAMVTKAS